MSNDKIDATFHPGKAPVLGEQTEQIPVHSGGGALFSPYARDPLTVPDWNVHTDTVPVWAGLAAQHGWSRTARHEDRGDGRTWTSPEAPDWARQGGDPRPWLFPTMLITVLVMLLGVVGLAVQRLNLLPAGVPLIGKDSGVAACEAIAHGEKIGNGATTMSETDYKVAREVFADSRYPSIRDNGTKIIDLAWQMQALKDNDLGMLAFVGPLTDAYSGLAGGCAAVGYKIPALGK